MRPPRPPSPAGGQGASQSAAPAGRGSLGLQRCWLLPTPKMAANPGGWNDFLPLVQVNEPRGVYEDNPSFLVAEATFCLLLLCCTADAALRKGRQPALWIACLSAGGSIEVLTIMHRQIGNFYHSQSTIMLLGGREPFYMLFGCYIWFEYAAISLAAQMKLAPLPEAAMAALLGRYLWACLDVVGLKYLWWTWHSDEPLYAERHNGVPIASTFWSMATIGALSYIFRILYSKPPPPQSPPQSATAKPNAAAAAASRVALSLAGSFSRSSASVKVVAGACLGPVASILLMNIPVRPFGLKGLFCKTHLPCFWADGVSVLTVSGDLSPACHCWGLPCADCHVYLYRPVRDDCCDGRGIHDPRTDAALPRGGGQRPAAG